MNKGKVYLVGAGPGDPKLITLRGMQCIKECTAIVYDRLASPRLLKEAPKSAKRVYVGKLPDRHTMKQEEINQLLVDLALEGHIVTRLKGGDPTIFGRVGEEAELLQAHQIQYEIVPGITSAISVPAYAGIPVTHRDHASSLSIITGHEKTEKLDKSIYWEKLTQATGTLLFLMGVAKIEYIAEQLIKYGRDPLTPVALVRWGTTPEQKTLIGELHNIADKVKLHQFESPAIIIVGDVVKQREKLLWYEKLPLFGLRVLLTRASEQNSSFVTKIEELGGEPCEFPVIALQKVSDTEHVEAIANVCQAIDQYDWIVLTSTNGVQYFFEWLATYKVDMRKLAHAKFITVGPKTEEALQAKGIYADRIAKRFDAEGILEALEAEQLSGKQILIPHSRIARTVLTEELSGRGATVTDLSIYDNIIATEQEPFVLDWLKEHHVHMLTFTSASTVRNFIDVLKQNGIEDPIALMHTYPIASIGPITSNTIRSYGLEVTIEAEEATIESLTQAIVAYHLANRTEPMTLY